MKNYLEKSQSPDERNNFTKFKDFNKFDLTIDRISNWWGWRRWRKRRGFGGKETAPEPHHVYLGPAPGAGGGVPAHPLSGLYAPGTDRGESGPHGGQSTGTYRKTYLTCPRPGILPLVQVLDRDVILWPSFLWFFTVVFLCFFFNSWNLFHRNYWK